MKNIIIIIFIFLSTNTFGQLNIFPSKPEVGQEINISYFGDLVKEGAKIWCIFGYDSTYNLVSKVIPSSIVEGKLVGQFILPDSVSFIMLYVAYKREIDNNSGVGYGFNVYLNGMPRTGTYFMEGNSIELNKFNFKGIIDHERALNLIEKEYALNPIMKNKTLGFYVKIMSKIPGRFEDAYALSEKAYRKVLETGNYDVFTYFYSDILARGNSRLSDSLKLLVEKKYPSGSFALNVQMNEMKFLTEDDPDFVIQKYTQLRKDFSLLLSNNRKILITRYLLDAYVTKGDTLSLEKTMKEISDSPIFFNTVSYGYKEMAAKLEKQNNLSKAKIYSELSILNFKKFDSLSSQYGEALAIYAKILFKMGDVDASIRNQRKAVYLTNHIRIDINEALVKYLMAANHFEDVLKVSEGFISENLGNEQIDSLYKVAYFNLNKKDTIGYESNLNRIKGISEDTYSLELEKKIIDVLAPDFELFDLNGAKVKLSDYRGSIVVLDFWATWCGPCLKAFPAMKAVMRELKDKQVKFLFVDTFEDDESASRTSEKIKSVLKKKEAEDFHVILDNKLSYGYKAAIDFKVPSIPAKYIIDTKGNLRYSSTGYDTDEKLIREIKSIIEILNR